MPRVKVSDLTDVKDFHVPLLRHGTGSRVVHIVERYGVYGDRPHDITNCNRAVSYTWMYGIPLKNKRYKLCPRCGDWKRFVEVRRNYRKFEIERRREREEEREREVERRQREVMDRNVRFAGLFSLLLRKLGYEAGHEITVVRGEDEIATAIKFWYAGRVYVVSEETECKC